MVTKEQGIKIIQFFESCRLIAYKDVVGVWTIGFGTTRYENNVPVKQGDRISNERAISLLKYDLEKFENLLNRMLLVEIKQHQFDALMSLIYNIGSGNLGKSTLLKKVNVNPDDPEIHKEFTKWCRAGGNVIPGLLKRRKVEANLYTTGKFNLA